MKVWNAFRRLFRVQHIATGLMLLSVWGAGAAQISVKQAATAAGNWAKRSPHPLEAQIGQTVREAKTYKDGTGNDLFHVVRFWARHACTPSRARPR